MACVAFDLDCTLGFFEIVNRLANLWSTEHLTNPEQSRNNSRLRISVTLRQKLQRARETFAQSLLKDPSILKTVIRPNLDALFLPLLEAKRTRLLKTIIMYSNTSSNYSIELAKYLIECIYQTRVFSLEANYWHPLRQADAINYKAPKYVEPYKTMETLQKLFKKALHQKAPIPVKNILFVDDRIPKHRLEENEAEGLTYIVPTPYAPVVTPQQRDYILFLAFNALVSQGLTKNAEYLNSGFCHRNIPYDYTKIHRVDGLTSLLEYVRKSMDDASDGSTWVPDTRKLSSEVRAFLHQVQPNGNVANDAK